MIYTYLDTSALMRRVESMLSESSDRSMLIRPTLDMIFDDRDRSFACSELTLLEFHSNLTTIWRNTAIPAGDQEWWEAARAWLFDLIAEGRIAVLPIPPKVSEHVMSIVTVATEEHGSAVRAWDTLHAIVAGSWAYELQAPVVILTSDDDFEKVLKVTSFGNSVTFDNLDLLSHTGCGMDK